MKQKPFGEHCAAAAYASPKRMHYSPTPEWSNRGVQDHERTFRIERKCRAQTIFGRTPERSWREVDYANQVCVRARSATVVRFDVARLYSSRKTNIFHSRQFY